MLKHGGNLQRARREYPQVKQPWLDLSTGISPWGWPVSHVPDTAWQRLPELTPSFDEAVKNYYGVADLIPIAGSQVAIELLATLVSKARVALPVWGYAEHLKSWKSAGHELVFYSSYDELITLVDTVEHAVIINPNNPTGDYWKVEQLSLIQMKLSGYLIVDEAFIDSVDLADEPQSMLFAADNESCVVLRSMGKFFGLAGIRLGFVRLPARLREPFIEQLTLWSISSPSLWVAEQALNDHRWQQQQRQRINDMSSWVFSTVKKSFPHVIVTSGSLFVSVYDTKASIEKAFRYFADQGIYLRMFENTRDPKNSYLRFGLPQNKERLEEAFDRVKDIA